MSKIDPKYTVLMFPDLLKDPQAKMSYKARQIAANKAKADLFVALHLNSCGALKPDYVLSKIGCNASKTSMLLADDYTDRIAAEFGYEEWDDKLGDETDGVARGGAGDYQLRFTAMPAILTEPLMCSNPAHAAIIRSDDGRQRLAQVLADTIRAHFPKGGLIAVSVGHAGKVSVNDPGAPVYEWPGGLTPSGKIVRTGPYYEAEASLDIARRLKKILESGMMVKVTARAAVGKS